MLTIKKPERYHWRRSDVFIANFEHIAQLLLLFIWLTLNKKMLAGQRETVQQIVLLFPLLNLNKYISD